jgi:hypothetical protein
VCGTTRRWFYKAPSTHALRQRLLENFRAKGFRCADEVDKVEGVGGRKAAPAELKELVVGAAEVAVDVRVGSTAQSPSPAARTGEAALGLTAITPLAPSEFPGREGTVWKCFEAVGEVRTATVMGVVGVVGA